MDRVSTRGDRTLVAEERGVMVVSSARAVESIAIRDDGASMIVNKRSRGVEAQKVVPPESNRVGPRSSGWW